MTKTKQELRDLVEELEKYKGRATELVTVYIPAGQNIYTVADQLEAEKSTAKNIKSTATRKNVGNALDKITRHLKEFKKTPENGLAIFSGNISRIEGQDDLRLWDIEPPMPLKTRMYRCDKDFILDPLKELLEVTEVYGLLVMDRKEATIGLLEGKGISVIQKMTSGIPSKVRAGGQCLSPDTLVKEKNHGKIELKDVKEDYLLEGMNLDTLESIFNKCKKIWSVKKENSISFITNGDYPSSEINSSLDHKFYTYDKRKIVEKIASDLKVGDFLIGKNGKLIKILSIDKSGVLDKVMDSEIGRINYDHLIDVEVENKNFFANGLLVHNSSQRFHRITEGLTKEFYKRIAEEMKKSFFDLPKLKGIIIGGPIPTKDEFVEGDYLPAKLREKVLGKIDIGDSSESGLKELMDKSQNLLMNHERVQEIKEVEKFFQSLGENPKKTALGEEKTRKALEFGAVDALYLSAKIEKSLTRELTDLAEGIDAKIKIISTETTEGEQFFNMGGVGAILRFEI